MPYLRPARPLQLTDNQVYLRTMAGAIETLRTGATMVVDDMSLANTLNVDTSRQLSRPMRTWRASNAWVSMIDKAIVDSWPLLTNVFHQTFRRICGHYRDQTAMRFDLVRDFATHHPKEDRWVFTAPSAPQRCTNNFLKKAVLWMKEIYG